MGLTRLDGSVEAQLKLEAAARFCSFHDTNFERSGRVSHVGGMTHWLSPVGSEQLLRCSNTSNPSVDHCTRLGHGSTVAAML
jgi:hypothetical protein